MNPYPNPNGPGQGQYTNNYSNPGYQQTSMPVPSASGDGGYPPQQAYGYPPQFPQPASQAPYPPPPPSGPNSGYPAASGGYAHHQPYTAPGGTMPAYPGANYAPASSAYSQAPPQMPPRPLGDVPSYGHPSGPGYPPRPAINTAMPSASIPQQPYSAGPMSAAVTSSQQYPPMANVPIHAPLAAAAAAAGAYYPPYSIPEFKVGDPRFPLDGVNGFHGPLLRFGDMNFQTKVYSASVLVISTRGHLPRSPVLTIYDHGEVVANVDGEDMDQLNNHIFWRFPFRLKLTDHERPVQYCINSGPRHTFTLPSAHRSWRWMFYSCNGFSESLKDPQGEFQGCNPLWDDFLAKHERQPFHVMVGGGDQLYCDSLWKLPELQPWLDMKDKKKRKVAPFTPEMRAAVERFYFNHYVYMFLYESNFKTAAATVPYAMMIDDHDIFDGFGSYPDYLQQSHVFRGIGAVALRFYLLFQQHSTVAKAPYHQLFGHSGFSWLRHFGETTAVLGIDTRFERTLEQVVSEASYDKIFDALRSHLATPCQHLVVVLGVPIIYPRMGAAEGALSTLANTPVGTLLKTTGAFSGAMNAFGEPELLDDLNDHWTAKIHGTERTQLILRFQAFAKARNIRVTFLSGDVHCCGVGKFQTKPKSKKEVLVPHSDHRLMYQVISSAIVNAPPPLALLRTLHVTSSTNVFDKYTEERMVELFETDVDGTKLTNRKLMGRRNFCTVTQDGASRDLMFSIHVETLDHQSTVPYTVNVPVLQGAPDYY